MTADNATYQNVARDDSVVGEQIAHIDTQIRWAGVVHQNSTTYQYSSASPDETFDAAKRYLAGGAGRKAADLIIEVTAHRASSEIAYYWQLALLANRPFDHLELEDFRNLEAARHMAGEATPDRWTEAVSVVDELLQCYIASMVPEVEFDGERFDRVMDRFEDLDPDLREELTRHLSLLLSGAVQDRLDATRCRQIEQDRMGAGRRRRVPLFFEPDPELPRRRSARLPDRGLRLWFAFVLGGLVVLGAAVTFAAQVAASDLLAASVVAALWVGSALVLARVGPRYLDLRAHNRRRQDPFPAYFGFVPAGPRAEATAEDGPSRELQGLVLARLAERPPDDPASRDRFTVLVDAAARSLTPVLHHLYGRVDSDPVPPPRIDWLVRWHARRIVDAWEARELRAVRAPRRLPWSERALLGVALVTAVAGAGAGLLAVARAGRGMILGPAGSALVLLAGCWLVLRAAPIYTEGRRHRGEQEVNDSLYELERAAYENEVERLRDRPDDPQMAEWLAYDKDHVRIEAMRTWKLTNRDVIMHVVLTEQADPSISACEKEGPRRYSRYLVQLFLLTGNGVRQLNVEVDFASGALNNEKRFAFRYDAIASVHITEPTVRRHGRRQVATPRGGGPNGNPVRPVLRQSLQLTLFNGAPIGINANYEPLMAEGRRDQAALTKLEQETTGAVSTLRTLESVAGEGKEWIMRERERSRRTISDYERTRFGSAPEPDSPPPDVGPVHPLVLAGWERASVWGYDALGRTFYADLTRNGSDGTEGPAIRLSGDPSPIATQDELARKIAERTGLPLFQIRAALVTYG